MSLTHQWQHAFLQTVQQHEHANLLRSAAVRAQLGQWTDALTNVVCSACSALQWQPAAKGHKLDLLPESRHEYPTMDVMAFPASAGRWCFPIAAMELENSTSDDRIAYSLWKVLCVRAQLRVVFCYRQQPNEGTALVRCLEREVIGAASRSYLDSEILIVVGSRGEAETFPYGFFKWWLLENNTGIFQLVR